MNTIPGETWPSHAVFVTVLLRDLDALRAACRRRGWEFRQGETSYRWFGRWLAKSPPPANLGQCDHAIGIPGCVYEIGLVAQGDYYLPIWDAGMDGGLEATLGPGLRRFWRSYAMEKLRRAAQNQGHTVGSPIDLRGTLRVRIAETSTQRSAHVRMAADGSTTLWTFGPSAWESFRYLADALGHASLIPDGDCP